MRNMPSNEPEIMRVKGRKYVTWCNEHTRKPYGEWVHVALELAEQAYEVHDLPYKPGLRSMEIYPPDRFTWICDEDGDAKQCIKIRDDLTGREVVWPHWLG
jgi:hypothetical protein